MATYKVSYFQIKGGGEIVRLVLFVGGQQFEDERLSMDEWQKVKQKTPTKQMPMLTVAENGKETKVYGQSGALVRYLAKKFGLFGKSPEEELLIDEAYECVIDAQNVFIKLHYEKDDKKKADIIENLREEILKRLDDYLELRAGKYGKNGYIIGNSMSIADLQLYNLVDQSSCVAPDLYSPFIHIQKHADFVKSDPKIAEWTKKSEQTKQ